MITPVIGTWCCVHWYIGSDVLRTLLSLSIGQSRIRHWCLGHDAVYIYVLSVTQQPNSSLSRLVVKVPKSNKIRHTPHPLGLLWTSDQPVAETATYTTCNKHKRRTSMPSAGFGPAIPTTERRQTCVIELTATTWIYQNTVTYLRLQVLYSWFQTYLSRCWAERGQVITLYYQFRVLLCLSNRP
jgi:hypothetical protein